MATTKDKPTGFNVTADRNVFSVKYKGPTIFDDQEFEFTVHADGDVVINDNVFNNKKQAADVLEAMAKYFRK